MAVRDLVRDAARRRGDLLGEWVYRGAMLAPGDDAPDFSLLDDEGNTRTLREFFGQKLVLWFYPKADTPG